MQLNDPLQDYKKVYIKLSRGLQNHWLWTEKRKFSKLEAFLYLLFKASFKDETEPFGKDMVILKRGQLLTSQENLSVVWQWNRQVTRTFLKLLEKDKIINQQSSNKFTIITICKYDRYQDKPTTNNQQNSIKQPAANQQSSTSNKVNKVNQLNKEEGVAPTLEDVLFFFKSSGYKKEAAVKAFEHYEKNDWNDNYGTPVLDWKAKMVKVWFKPEDKEGVFNIPDSKTIQR